MNEKLLSQDDHVFRNKVNDLAKQHKKTVTERNNSKFLAVSEQIELDALRTDFDKHPEIREMDVKAISKAVGEYARNKQSVVEGHLAEADLHETARKAALWDSREHLEVNREAYEDLAIEDANAAGQHIDFGGQHYPATPPEQPKQSQ